MVTFVLSVLKDLDLGHNYLEDGIYVFVFLILHFLTTGYIYSAAISSEHICIGEGDLLNWSDVLYIRRFHYIYYLKTKETMRLIFFPIERLPMNFLEVRIEDGDMDQIIGLMKKRLKI